MKTNHFCILRLFNGKRGTKLGLKTPSSSMGLDRSGDVKKMSREVRDKLKTTICVSIIVLAIAGWVRQARATCAISNFVIKDGIEYYMQTDKAVYSLGEKVKMMYRVTNLSNQDVTFWFANQQQSYFKVSDGATIIWYRPHQFLPAVSEFTLGPGEFKGYFEQWSMVNERTGNPVTPGIYDITGALFSVKDPAKRHVPVSVQIEIMAEPCCGDPNHPYPLGDLNCDCYVDIFDLAILCSHWLELMVEPYCGDSSYPYPAGDLNCDCYVDILDLEILCSRWLECTATECD